MEPEPRVDKQGVSWCSCECQCYQDEDGCATCTHERRTTDSFAICEPKVREMAAELERLKIALQRAVAGPDMYDHYRVLSRCPPNCSLDQWLKNQALDAKEE